MYEQTFLIADEGPWVRIRDAQLTARLLHGRHYSKRRYRDGRDPAKFIGPGEYLALLTPCARALFAWRKFRDKCIDQRTGLPQAGINCCVFRNEGAGLSSDLIRAADALADERWPGERHYTYVDPREIRSSNPGYCFLRAGWQRCGRTKGGLVILERNK